MEETGQSRHPPGSPLYDWAEEARRAPSARVPVSDERPASAPPTREVERRAAGEEQAAPTGPARGNGRGAGVERSAATVERHAAGSASVKMGGSRRARTSAATVERHAAGSASVKMGGSRRART
ncbi:MAG: hypothetical protein M3083_06630, partial [Actinomycetota bacterium]|nr:hypothetical protein [Actinomycetota bacterium]